MDAGHRVERMSEDRGAGLERGCGLSGIRAGVADGGDGPCRDDASDGVHATEKLGCDGDLAHRAATGIEQTLHVSVDRVAQQ